MRQGASPRKSGLVSAIFGAALTHPTLTLGMLVMTATAVAILANALAFQHGRHPAPLFVGTRPAASVGTPATPHAQPPATSATQAAASLDSGLVADIQRGLKEFGYYKGEIDGLAGPQTEQAILAFERAFHLAPTGEPSNNVLIAIRSVRQKLSGEAAYDSQSEVDPITVSTLPETTIPVPLPKPAADRRSSAEPAGGDARGSIGSLIAALDAPTTVQQVATAAPRPPAAPTAGADAPEADPRLARIQQSLAAQGFGPDEIDGRMSAQTRQAIRRFETYYNLPLTGAISETFLAQLVKVGGLQAR